MFVAVLFIISLNWKLSRCPSKGEWFGKLRYIQRAHYLAIERNELMIHIRTWMNLKKTMLNEESQ